MRTWSQISKKERIERWENARRVLRQLTPHQRRKHFDMGTFGYKNECGTIACAAGQCGLDTWFRRRGLKLDFDEDGVRIEAEGGDYSVDVAYFFGHTGSKRIFFNGTHRPVGRVIREITEYIKELKDEAAS